MAKLDGARGNYFVQVNRYYESFVDIYSPSHIEFSPKGQGLHWTDLKKADDVGEMLASCDVSYEIDVSDYLVFSGLGLVVEAFGSCKKCAKAFDDGCDAYSEKFCANCGAKRLKTIEVFIPVSSKKVPEKIVRQGNWEATSYKEEMDKYLKKKSISRYWAIELTQGVSFFVKGKTLAQIEKMAIEDAIWLQGYEEFEAIGATALGLCSKCNRDCKPGESFCPGCGKKNSSRHP